MVANAPAIYVHRHVASTLLSDVRPRSAPALELVALPRSGEPHTSRAA